MNNKGADQTARMGRLVCAFVVHKPGRQVFSHGGPFSKDPDQLVTDPLLHYINSVDSIGPSREKTCLQACNQVMLKPELAQLQRLIRKLKFSIKQV